MAPTFPKMRSAATGIREKRIEAVEAMTIPGADKEKIFAENVLEMLKIAT